MTISRLRRGLNPFTTPGRDHLSHRLTALGLTRREAVLVCYLLTGIGGMVGIYVAQAALADAWAAAGLLGAAMFAGIVWLERSPTA